jgi:hypothetical protein
MTLEVLYSRLGLWPYAKTFDRLGFWPYPKTLDWAGKAGQGETQKCINYSSKKSNTMSKL